MFAKVRLSLGFDTVSTALSWSIVYMVAYPDVQERLYQELSKKGFYIRQKSLGLMGKSAIEQKFRVKNDMQMLLLASSSRARQLQFCSCHFREKRGSESRTSPF